MEPPKGFWATLWSFLCFLPVFMGLLLLGVIKSVILCPLICLIITIGNSAVIIGLWPVHFVWTNYSILITKQLGPVLKLVSSVCISVFLLFWPLVAIVGSIMAGAGYGLLAPLSATFEAVGEGKKDQFFHCIYDGTWSTIKGSFTAVRDFKDVCFRSYFSLMEDLRLQEPADGEPYEIRLILLPCALLVGVLGFMVDMPAITLIALFKGPYMLFKGWHRLFHDLIGREGPFLETICVPFAGLAILLWPLAVTGAILGSMVSSIFLGAYAAVVVYQESSVRMGFRYIIAAIAIFDEYSNDVLDMPVLINRNNRRKNFLNKQDEPVMTEGSCFPRLWYRNKSPPSRSTSRASSLSRPKSFNQQFSHSGSLRNSLIELNPLELLQRLFIECKLHGENMVMEGLIRPKDIEEAKSKSNSGSKVVSIGLPAYCILQGLLRSIKENSEGLLLGDNVTEISSANRPKDVFFDWFLNPLWIIKEQIKVLNLSEGEDNYLSKLVLLRGDPERLQNLNSVSPLENEQKRGELDGIARRVQGITRSISRYPTFGRRFHDLVQTLSEELAKKNGGSGPPPTSRSKSLIIRLLSQRSFGRKLGYHDPIKQTQLVVEKDLEIA